MENTVVCHLMSKTPSESDLVPTYEHFNCLKVFVDDSHVFRYLLQCKLCGQLYFYEFYEEIDWANGNDPQYVTFIPVKSAEIAEELNRKSPMGLLEMLPRLQHDTGKGNTGVVRWVR